MMFDEIDNSILLVDKPKGISSAKVVELIKKKFKVKVGHTGTLDPLATGLLIILTGKKTKEASSFVKLPKVYEVKAILGITTDTFDMEGKILNQNPTKISKEKLEKTLKKFLGDILQAPPTFSAKKFKGKKAYELARKGVRIKLPKQKVKIYSLRLKNFKYPLFEIICKVSSGTYIRSLINDIGKDLKVGATVLKLRRVAIGKYKVKKAVSLEDLLSKTR